MSADVTETETFRIPREQVFDYLVDFSNLAQWDPTFDRSRAVDDGPVGPGSRFEVVATVGGTELPITYTVQEYVRPRHAKLVGEGDGFTSIDELHLEQVGDETRLTWDATVDSDVAVVDTMATPLFELVAKASIAGLRDTLGGQG